MFVEDIHMEQKLVPSLALKPGTTFNLEILTDAEKSTKYFKALELTAERIIGGGFPEKVSNLELLSHYHCSNNGFQSGLSIVHPFLEVGGALRTQVPLPKTMSELGMLLKVVLHDYGSEYLEDFAKSGLRDFRPRDGFNVKISHNIGLLVWNDAASMHRNNKKFAADIDDGDFFQSLSILLISVIYQRADLSYYGKRGRYGPETLRRLIDGHASSPTELSPPNKTITTFTYYIRNGEKEFPDIDGMPFAAFSGVVIPSQFNYQDEQGAWLTCDAEKPTLQLNYTFTEIMPRELQEKNRGKFKHTEFIVAGLLLKASQLENVAPDKFYLTIHTDKCAAAKGFQKYMQALDDKCDIYKAISRKVWTNVIHNRLQSFRAEMECTHKDWKMLFFVDRSTVEEGDPGEEVPFGCDRFYHAIYPEYCRLIKKRTGQEISKQLLNGVIDEKQIGEFCEKHGLPFERLMELLHTKQVERTNPDGKKVEFNFVDDGRISIFWLMNNRHSGEAFVDDLARMHKKEPKVMASPEEMAQELGMLLNTMAKTGNTANSHSWAGEVPNVDLDVPRLTEFAYILTGEVKLSSAENSQVQPNPQLTGSLGELQKILRGQLNLAAIRGRVLNA
ncbi:hypothetical protein [Sneathiella glossodoripedis]|uniref:hypothetical protein n=1 Tax=Sneathiella glossodoripedis TaxID=418853 RepID=UPI000470EFBF|nr:hypothetical protein [Sneathiella glossodoripedis]